jgi:DNA relaxase NicK
MKASASIDWLSATIQADTPIKQTKQYEDALRFVGLSYHPDLIGGPFHRGAYNTRAPLAPAGDLLYSDTNKVAYATVELTGNACRDLPESTLLRLMRAATNISRLDVALDLEVELMPEDLIGAGYDAKFSTRESVVSDTGRTVYIGSRKSDRFLRVYRYTGPEHPRSHLLRLEWCLKDERARGAAWALCHKESGVTVDSLARGLIDAYGLVHEVLGPFLAGKAHKVIVPRKNVSFLGRWAWLMTAVKPALCELEPDELERLLEGVPAFESIKSRIVPF